MFHSKVLLCGVPVVVLVMGALVFQAHLVAQQRERAEAESRQAEEALRAFKEQRSRAEQLARQAIVKADGLLRDEANNVRPGLDPNLDKALAQLAELRAAQIQRFLQERQKLTEQMKKLEIEERETLARIDAKTNELQRQFKNRPAPEGDKLDRILERLDRIEQRLERLERAGSRKR